MKPNVKGICIRLCVLLKGEQILTASESRSYIQAPPSASSTHTRARAQSLHTRKDRHSATRILDVVLQALEV